MNHNTVETLWDDIYHDLETKPPQSSGSPQLDTHIKAYKKNSKSILDFGCGNGKLLYLFLHEHLKTVQGIDISGEAIKKANALFSHTNKPFSFQQGSIDTLQSIEKESFDLAMLMNILDNLEEKDAITVLRQVYRLMKPFGKVFVKLNAHMNDKSLNAYGLSRIDEDFYHEPSGLYLLNKPDSYWQECFENKLGFKVIEKDSLDYPDYDMTNRLFILEKPIGNRN